MNRYSTNDMLRPAFALEEFSGDFDPEVPPHTPQEYLHRVILEASACSDIVHAEIDPTKIKPQDKLEVLPGLDSTSSDLVPSFEWQHCQVVAFSKLRKRVCGMKTAVDIPPMRLPGRKDERGWHVVCVGSGENVGKFEPSLPLLSILHNPTMNQPILLQVLEYNVNWLQNEFSEVQAKWLYALLACLELPLYPETCSCLRQLARECARIRAQLDSPNHPHLASLNLLITLVSRYYRQLDLAE